MSEKDKIDELLTQRGNQWGDAVVTHADIAQVWSGILGHEVTAQQVALCMVGLKLVRARVNPENEDSYDDAHGYVKIAEWIVFEGRDPRNAEPTEDQRQTQILSTLGITDESQPIPYTLDVHKSGCAFEGRPFAEISLGHPMCACTAPESVRCRR